MIGLVYTGHCTASSTCIRWVHSLHERWRHIFSQITLGFLVELNTCTRITVGLGKVNLMTLKVTCKMSPLHKITALLLSHFSCRIPLNVLLHITVFSYTEMPTLPFPPGGSRFYARNTASRFGCKTPVFHTTPHIYLFNERKHPVQVAHEVSREFRLFTNINIWQTVQLNKALW